MLAVVGLRRNKKICDLRCVRGVRGGERQSESRPALRAASVLRACGRTGTATGGEQTRRAGPGRIGIMQRNTVPREVGRTRRGSANRSRVAGHCGSLGVRCGCVAWRFAPMCGWAHAASCRRDYARLTPRCVVCALSGRRRWPRFGGRVSLARARRRKMRNRRELECTTDASRGGRDAPARGNVSGSG